MSSISFKRLSALVLLLSIFVLNSSVFHTAQADNSVQGSVLLDVPFTTQVPFGEWSDPRQRDGCEEASITMAIMWAQDKQLGPEEIRQYITGMSDYQEYFYGYFEDSSAKDTANLMVKYFNYPNVTTSYAISTSDIKAALDTNSVVIVPLNPRILNKKLYNKSVFNHTVIVVGYDNARKEIVFHDPLFSKGAYIRTSESKFQAALGDYPSGNHIMSKTRPKAMIVVSK